MQRYADRRKRQGNPLDNSAAARRRVAAECEGCSVAFLARADKPNRFCSLDCANDFQGRSDTPRLRFKIARSVRLGIFEAAGWACQLCTYPTRPDEDYNHPRYPTLDHIQPRAFGGGDGADNLRLACRQCNILRGTNVDWVPDVSEVTGEPFREVA